MEGAGRLTARRVLVVDHAPQNRAAARAPLAGAGYVVHEAGDGAEALGMAARERPNVILLDVAGSREDGIGVLAALQSDADLSEVPVVVLGERTEPAAAIEALRQGAHDYVARPFDDAELVARVHSATRTKMLRDELRARNAQLERLASTDALTGLYNRRFLDTQARTLGSRSRRHDSALAALLIDIDGFKAINDSHGHAAGDAVLDAVGDRLRSRLRAEDLVGRWGGEEFLVLAPDTGAGGAAALAEDLRAAVGVAAVEVEGVRVAVTVSVGWATWSGPDDDAEALLRRADAGLYAAKAAGRDAVRGG